MDALMYCMHMIIYHTTSDVGLLKGNIAPFLWGRGKQKSIALKIDHCIDNTLHCISQLYRPLLFNIRDSYAKD